jgi:pimeloyl-ACP methyl ester carboxylesterase
MRTRGNVAGQRVRQRGGNDSVSTSADQVDQANATNRTPVVFIHGLWLLPSSWDRWTAVFEEAG